MTVRFLYTDGKLNQGTRVKTNHLLELSPSEVQKMVLHNPLILIPVGTVEWHADHLPLGVDSLLSAAICDAIAKPTGVCVAPLLSSGICRDLQAERGYFGTVDTVREQTLAGLITDLLQGYAKMGFTKAAIVSGHFETEHFSAISEGIKNAKSIQGIFLTAFDFCKEKVQELEDVTLTWPFAGDHAAEWETSLMLYAYPKLVQMKKAPETIELDMPGLPDYIRRRYPRRANHAYGRKIYHAVIQGGIEVITKMSQRS